MKKSKLLYPLMGLAGAATIAMPLVLTSCNNAITINVPKTGVEGAWMTNDVSSYRSENKYIFALEDSASKASGTVLSISIYKGGLMTEFSAPKSVTINGVDATYIQQVQQSHTYRMPSGLSGNLNIKVQFDGTFSDVLIGFIIV